MERTFNVEIVLPRDVHDVVAYVRLHRFDQFSVCFLEDEGDPIVVGVD